MESETFTLPIQGYDPLTLEAWPMAAEAREGYESKGRDVFWFADNPGAALQGTTHLPSELEKL